MNSILFCGDPHGQFENIINAVKTHQPKAIIMLGDYGLENPLETMLAPIIGEVEIHWIAGNHDFDQDIYYKNLFDSALKSGDLNLKVVDINGIKIAGLAGIFKGKFWKEGEEPKFKNKQAWLNSQPSNVKKAVKKKGMPLHVQTAIWFDELEYMKKNIQADILVSHEAPSCHRFGFSVIDELAEAIGAKHIIHGHHHEYYKAKINKGTLVTGVDIQGVINLDSDSL